MEGHIVAWTSAAALAVLACGSNAAPIADVARAHHAIQTADASGATDVPRAALHLKMSRDALRDADRLLRAGEHERAVQALREAEADAVVARALAREEHARQEADAALARISELERE